jgi:hypothetical protein
MWVMGYTQLRGRRRAVAEVVVGHRVTPDHPLVTVERWNREARDAAAAGGPPNG